jgi:hypothetical protein
MEVRVWRYLVGAGAGLLLVFAGLMLGKVFAGPGAAASVPGMQGDGLASPMSFGALPEPPRASDLSREQKRFNRYDRDRNGRVDRAEYLSSRQKAFARLDLNGDGRLDFEEYAVKAAAKFKAADKNANSALDTTEFSTTRVVRKAKPKCECSPQAKPVPDAPDEEEPGA